MKSWITFALGLVLLGFAGCNSYPDDFASMRERSGSAEEVRVFGKPPATYREIGVVEAKHGGWLGGDARQWNRALGDLREEAAKLGANGIIVAKLGQYQNAAVAEAYGAKNAYGDAAPRAFLKPEGKLSAVAIEIPVW